MPLLKVVASVIDVIVVVIVLGSGVSGGGGNIAYSSKKTTGNCARSPSPPSRYKRGCSPGHVGCRVVVVEQQSASISLSPTIRCFSDYLWLLP